MTKFYGILSYFFLITVVGSALSYIRIDPIKSRFFLIFSILTGIPFLSFIGQIWFSYFVCLIFLRGIFVILVYFSSLSKIKNLKTPFVFLISLMILLFFFPNIRSNFLGSSLVNFYFDIYWVVFLWIVICLIFFINFARYFLRFSGALRKV